MKHFIVYDKTTGWIRRMGVCLDQDLERQANPENNEAAIEAHAPDKNIVLDGVPSYIEPPPLPPPTSEELASKEEGRFLGELLRGLSKYVFLLENRVRTLEGKAPVSSEQFKSAIRGLM